MFTVLSLVAIVISLLQFTGFGAPSKMADEKVKEELNPSGDLSLDEIIEKDQLLSKVTLSDNPSLPPPPPVSHWPLLSLRLFVYPRKLLVPVSSGISVTGRCLSVCPTSLQAVTICPRVPPACRQSVFFAASHPSVRSRCLSLRPTCL